MKLSEAIRLGAMATTQGFGAASILSDDAPCALGAVRVAAGISRHAIECASKWEPLSDRFPLLLSRVIAPGALRIVGGVCTMSVMEIIWRLNDTARLTREQIADWVETVEAKETPHSVAVVECAAAHA